MFWRHISAMIPINLSAIVNGGYRQMLPASCRQLQAGSLRSPDLIALPVLQQTGRVLQRGIGLATEHARDLFLPRFPSDFAQPRMGPALNNFFGHDEMR